MTRRHPRAIPRLWLMTDDRMGEALLPAIERLPRGAGIVFRHYTLAPAARRALFARVARIARRRHLVLIRAGDDWLGGGEAGVHGTARTIRGGLRTWPAHSRAEAIAGIRAGADVIFVSPVFPTRSHPGARALGAIRAAGIARDLPAVRIALGGVAPDRAPHLRSLGFHGWAGVDAWLADQKRKAVPI